MFISLEAVLKYVYAGKLPLEHPLEIVMGVVPIAEKYDIQDLKIACADIIRWSLDKDGIVDAWVLAHTYGCAALDKACREQFWEWKDSLEADAWKKLEAYPKLMVDIIKTMNPKNLQTSTVAF